MHSNRVPRRPFARAGSVFHSRSEACEAAGDNSTSNPLLTTGNAGTDDLDAKRNTGSQQFRKRIFGSLPLFAVRRADIETFARDLEARGRARATVTRRLCTIAGFYEYAVEEEPSEPTAKQ